MNLAKILSSTQLKKISKEVGLDSKIVETLVSEAAPELVGGLIKNSSKSKSGAESLLNALLSHADDDDDKVDEDDGAKVLEHVLGKDKTSLASTLAKSIGGVDSKTVVRVLAMAAPILLKTLGKDTKKTKASKGDLDVTDLLGAVLGGSSAKSNKKDGFDLGDALETAQKVGKLLGK